MTQRDLAHLQAAFISCFCLFSLFSNAAANFHEDDFVPTSRRAQFHGVRILTCTELQQHGLLQKGMTEINVCTLQSRTHWHDLLGRHCPRFGRDHLVSHSDVVGTAPCLV